MSAQPTLFDEFRMTLDRAKQLTIADLTEVGALYKHWSISFSGGKDSTTVATLVLHLIEEGLIPRPESLHVTYADTRMELPPLHFAAMETLKQLEARGCCVKIVQPELDHRFFVYMFGRGVPAPMPSFRWCVGLLKVRGMNHHLEEQWAQFQAPFLSLTGVRIGESAARDQRIALSCGKDGAECSQGYLQSQTPTDIATIHHPIIHWRVCNVFDWLMFEAPAIGFTAAAEVARIYGGDEAEELNARTGCVGCNVAQKETALDYILTLPEWRYLAPLKHLKPLYREMASPQFRHRKPGGEMTAKGLLVSNQNRLGPYTMESRRYGLQRVLEIQEQINQVAAEQGRPIVTLIDPEELSRIYWHWENDIYPDKWDGTEPTGDQPFDRVFPDGSVQPVLPLWS